MAVDIDSDIKLFKFNLFVCYLCVSRKGPSFSTWYKQPM